MLKQTFLDKQLKKALIFNTIWWLILIIIFIVFSVIKTLNWINLISLVIAYFCSYIAIFLLFLTKLLIIKYQNPYLIYLMFLLRIGIYVIPLFIALLLSDENIFSYLGILIGYSSNLVIPFFIHKRL
ncbi:MG406 family protein [Mycoplasma mycoides subsp. mycoides]|uniref:Membrane protein n=2 Tax=Mycoplasma mycoides subsp. mycoides TaxID=2103 RepID=A0AAE2EIH2_MYCMY|nr:MG406 family protein [Mycoplasma mycoides]CAE77503.1 Hypothetical transmembrane protein [Mycoplasma mycoides subsp. mycoides SC str. PG1]AIZ55755.1 hypothetical protein mycmycITA_00942 [Mycoplasma mycoides subsp. mycoides]AMK56217.1 hypothetical protein MSCT144_02960 [Mycoplasma mycoides subsp. mycoides]KJQ46376.1 putative membrane protein [Mycoplasma mycoides subsp. mycoides]KJQ46845.1 putative membrane protein [Mycoplasma mycoides subsp. mycoides]